MNIFDLRTPAFLLDLDILENNIINYQSYAKRYGKKFVPMTKTHKSSTIAKMQLAHGADGFVVGTVDEALKLAKTGAKEITIPYPLLGVENLTNLLTILNKVNLILSVDSEEVMKIYNDFLKQHNLNVNCLVIINTGLNRFGINPELTGEFVKLMKSIYRNLIFKGISTHPGQVYSEESHEGVINVAKTVYGKMTVAYNSLNRFGFNPEYICTGSTPTYFEDVKMDLYNCIRPGNYVFHDRNQMILAGLKETDCALTVLATIISHPLSNRFVIDCGSKTLGLDKGAHSSNSIKDYGHIIGHKELFIKSLSEEVGIIEVLEATNVKIGDKIQIIPNHSCSACNMTNYLIGHRNNRVEQIIEVDIRENSIAPKLKEETRIGEKNQG